jgi:methionyl aminopeptidase
MSIQAMLIVAGCRQPGASCHQTLEALAAAAAPGVTTADLDAVAARIFAAHGARSRPRSSTDFPARCSSA